MKLYEILEDRSMTDCARVGDNPLGAFDPERRGKRVVVFRIRERREGRSKLDSIDSR